MRPYRPENSSVGGALSSRTIYVGASKAIGAIRSGVGASKAIDAIRSGVDASKEIGAMRSGVGASKAIGAIRSGVPRVNRAAYARMRIIVGGCDLKYVKKI